MNIIMRNSQRFGRIRRLHTIISQETIKPSSPTPQHLKIHNISLMDHFSPTFLMPKVYFYKNYNKNNTKIIKQSLSKSLSQYYPFAGRFPTPELTYVDCNDQGIEFIEASIDSEIDAFIVNKNQDETFDQLIPHGLEGSFGKTSSNNLLKVQLNHFAGGGAALAVSVSHRIADGFTAASFINHWANVTRGESFLTPNFLLPSSSNDEIKIPEVTINNSGENNDYIVRSFIFCNSKLQELKKKVTAKETTLTNPTRVEALTSLLFKCVVGATTPKSGHLNPVSLLHTINMRNKIMKSSHEIAAGNIMTMVIAKMANSGEIVLDEVIRELRKVKKEAEELRDVHDVGKHFLNTILTLENDKGVCNYVVSSSLCRLPFYNADFGWGKPCKVKTRYPDTNDNGFLLFDTPSGDGIEAVVHLKREEMPIFEMDKELLEYIEEK